MGKYCPNCNEFDELVNKIDGAIVMAWAHGQWDEDESITFKYCPYCGSELKDL